ncbi:DUF6320 domain-containing protein [Adhaeribacter rhizoryzae]|uniref:Zinc ribbon domain-containing protein n=1 Tax=Adhaeribacter rhizoryzae TaxID=2607907 RepID=A0A5M6CY68_9BACT|nr:DUF6320 domain-containing protein [Adhaeribacter rhizoryzae]KAA5538942.1 hypothetical protein F0145_25290 [Adhaeribacter rhizoryzae]
MPSPIICDQCGVELESEMLVCPLCNNPVSTNLTKQNSEVEVSSMPLPFGSKKMNQPQKKITWEVVSIVLCCAIIATSTINLIINNKISWAEYPVAICLIIFSYISVFAFLAQRTIIQVLVSFLVAAAALFLLDLLTNGLNWAPALAIPILLAFNLILIGLLVVFRSSSEKGVNLIGYSFLGAALLCICIEVFLDFYLNKPFRLWWSVIVGLSVLPVSLVLLLMHYRYKRGRDLGKTFHI